MGWGWGSKVSGGKVGSAGGAGWAARRVWGVEAAVRLPVILAGSHFPHTRIKMGAGAATAAVLNARQGRSEMAPAQQKPH